MLPAFLAVQLSFQFQAFSTQRQADCILRIAAHAHLDHRDSHLSAVAPHVAQALFLMLPPSLRGCLPYGSFTWLAHFGCNPST
jgi:hypothetical protein